MGARARHGHDPHRGHAARRDRAARVDQFLPLSVVRARLLDRYTLDDLPDRTGGPARYVRVEGNRRPPRLHHPADPQFLRSCNRVRLTCTGKLFMCLGQEDAADLRTPVRALGRQRAPRSRDRGRHRAQAQRPRLRHRPPQPPGRRPSHERDRRLTVTQSQAPVPRSGRSAGRDSAAVPPPGGCFFSERRYDSRGQETCPALSSTLPSQIPRLGLTHQSC